MLNASNITLCDYQQILNLNKNSQSKKRVSQPIKDTNLSRNKAQMLKQSEQSKKALQTKTIQINLNKMIHSKSQATLHNNAHYIIKSRGDTDEIQSPQKSQQIKQDQQNVLKENLERRKSPSPQKMNFHQDKRKSYLSNASNRSNNSNRQNLKQQTNLVSNTKTSKGSIPVNPNLTHQINAIRTTVSAVTSKQTNLQFNQPAINFQKQQLGRTSMMSNAHRVTNKNFQSVLSKSSSKPDLSSSVQSPSVMGQSSPKVCFNNRFTSGMTSVYSMQTDMITNSSIYYPGKEKKIALSEKLAPKIKKKRSTNVQKQPKQTSSSRDQINAFADTFQSAQPQITNHDLSNHQLMQPKLINSKTESINNSHYQLIEEIKAQIDIIPVTNKYSQEEQSFTKLYEKNDMVAKTLEYQTDARFQHELFRYPSFTQKAQKEYQEEEKLSSMTPSHYLDTLGNHNQSIENTIDKKSTQEVATPVFQGNNRRLSAQRVSDVTLQIDVKITEDSPKGILNEDKVKPNVRVRNIDIQTEKDIEDSINTISSFPHDKVMKKVHSTNDLGFSSQDRVLNSNGIMKRNQSNGGFFNKLKNILTGGKSDQNFVQENKMLYKCRCGSSGKSYACKRAFQWLQYSNNYSEFDYEKNKELYEGLIKVEANSGSENQIERDIPRTFTSSDSFMNTYEGQQKLSRVLNAFSQYFRSIGYVQGMNFIVGALLLHASEDIAFWLFVSLIEDYEMRDIYQPKLPGLYKHSQILQLLEMEHLNLLHQHFCQHNILIEMYASDWIFALFSNIIPLSEYHHFLDMFFIHGWAFFYKFSLSFLKCLQDEVLECRDISEILTIIKLKFTKKEQPLPEQNSIALQFDTDIESVKHYSDTTTNSPSKQHGLQFGQMKNMLSKFIYRNGEVITSESFKDDSVWERLISLSTKEWEGEYNDEFVQNLLSTFDPEKLIFRQSTLNTPSRESACSTPSRHSARKRNQSEYKNEVAISKKQDYGFIGEKRQIIIEEKATKEYRGQKQQMNGRNTLQPKMTRSLQAREPQNQVHNIIGKK